MNASAPTWSFETSTEVNDGQGDYVISGKRRSFAELVRSDNNDDVDSLMMENAELRVLVEKLRQQMDSGRLVEVQSEVAFTNEDQDQLRVALILSSLSFVMCIIGLVIFLRRVCIGGGTAHSS